MAGKDARPTLSARNAELTLERPECRKSSFMAGRRATSALPTG